MKPFTSAISHVRRAPREATASAEASPVAASLPTTVPPKARPGRVSGLLLLPGSRTYRADGSLARVTVPMQLKSAANLREHWTAAHRRKQGQRNLVCDWMPGVSSPAFPLVVTLCRVAPCPLDDDNLASAFKAVRDEVADCLGLPSDRDPRVTWRYEQRKDAPRTYGVEIRVEPRADVGGAT